MTRGRREAEAHRRRPQGRSSPFPCVLPSSMSRWARAAADSGQIRLRQTSRSRRPSTSTGRRRARPARRGRRRRGRAWAARRPPRAPLRRYPTPSCDACPASATVALRRAVGAARAVGKAWAAGATVALLLARSLAADWVAHRLGRRVHEIKAGSSAKAGAVWPVCGSSP